MSELFSVLFPHRPETNAKSSSPTSAATPPSAPAFLSLPPFSLSFFHPPISVINTDTCFHGSGAWAFISPPSPLRVRPYFRTCERRRQQMAGSRETGTERRR